MNGLSLHCLVIQQAPWSQRVCLSYRVFKKPVVKVDHLLPRTLTQRGRHGVTLVERRPSKVVPVATLYVKSINDHMHGFKMDDFVPGLWKVVREVLEWEVFEVPMRSWCFR